MTGDMLALGVAYGLFPIGWIVLNIIFLHQLTEQNGSFKVLQDSLSGITEDRRIQRAGCGNRPPFGAGRRKSHLGRAPFRPPARPC